GVELAPPVVGQVAHGLERVLVVLRHALVDEEARGALGLGRADVGGLENGADGALGGHGMLADELLVAEIVQQKYCDHGRSSALDTTTCPIFFARISCASGGKAMRASIFASARSFLLSSAGWMTHSMSLAGSSPTWAPIIETKR